MLKPSIFFYHDGRHPLIYMYEPPMRKEEYESAIDELAGTPVEAVTFCLGEGRVFIHDTKVGEVWGHNVKKWPKITRQRTHLNAKALIEEGNDPLRLVCNRAHEVGILLYPSLIVQWGSDTRRPLSSHEDYRAALKDGTNTYLFERSSDFRFENKHLEIGARGDLDPNFPGATLLDFKRKESRDERFGIIEEVLNNYPVDGFELQMHTNAYFFRPDEVDEGRGILTKWMRRVRDAVKKSGSDRELVVRVPLDLEYCDSVGMDLKEWVDQELVDVLIGHDMDANYRLNQNADFRPLVELAKGSECRVVAALTSYIHSDRLNQVPVSGIRGAACNYWDQGVDGLQLWHWFSQWPYKAPFYERVREVPHPQVMAPRDKFYFLLTETNTHTPGAPTAFQLPMPLETDEPATVELTITDDLPRWDEAGRVHEVILRVRIASVTELARLTFKLNGTELPDILLRKINEIYKMSAPRFRAMGSYWFIFKLDREHWPLKGRNTLEVTFHEDHPDLIVQTPYIRDVEMDIKYLMGKNFHREFVDADLGPYESMVS